MCPRKFKVPKIKPPKFKKAFWCRRTKTGRLTLVSRRPFP